MMKIILVSIFLFFAGFGAMGQGIDCSQFQHEPDDGVEELVTSIESPPILEKGFDELIVPCDSTQGKIYVEFVVDTTGKAQCIRVVKTYNELLNRQAIAHIKSLVFVPAAQRGKKVACRMVLPVIFGSVSTDQEKSGRTNRKFKWFFN